MNDRNIDLEAARYIDDADPGLFVAALAVGCVAFLTLAVIVGAIVWVLW